MTLRLSKLHGSGNDFLVTPALDGRSVPGPEVARALCDRRRGVGADGLLTLLPATGDADCAMQLRNADGGLAEMSGNGISCLAWVAAREGIGTAERIRVETDAGVRTVELRCDAGGEVVGATVDMGAVTFDPAEIPLLAPSSEDLEATFHRVTYRGDAVGVGNPHFVVLVDDVDKARVAQHGPRLEEDERFPNRTNVEFAALAGPDQVKVRIWERGVGETLSCGTGVAAVAAVFERRGLVGPQVVVDVPGGRHLVELGETARLSVSVTHVFDVELDIARLLFDAGLLAVSGTDGQGRQRPRLSATEIDLEVVRQRALLVGTDAVVGSVAAAEASLAELALLADTAGADAVDTVLQRRTRPDPATYVGSGKVEELRLLAEAHDVDVVIFDDELTPAQQRNLEKMLGRDVVDRVALILDIFAQHATSQVGMVQVELAELRYLLPRLRGRGVELSRQGGGIGTRRGPGETKLETDRRRILTRMTRLEAELRRLAQRATQRKARQRHGLRLVSLVGYTNAGKSTLLNQLTSAGVLVEDRLFSTLDSTTRRLELPGGERVLISDTVGFVRRLPHELVEAFRSTLDELADADLALHVVDASVPDAAEQMAAVRAVLAEVGADQVPEVLVVNKIDIADPDGVMRELLARDEGAVAVSAVTGEGIDKLVDVIGRRLRAREPVLELRVPHDRGDVIAALHRIGEVLVEVHDEDGARLRVRLPQAEVGHFSAYAAAGDPR